MSVVWVTDQETPLTLSSHGFLLQNKLTVVFRLLLQKEPSWCPTGGLLLQTFIAPHHHKILFKERCWTQFSSYLSTAHFSARRCENT